MLVRDDGICIGQAAHAWVSGQLARAWAGEVPHREAACLAAEQHDVGMAEWDLEPARDPGTGRPLPFMRMPLDVHLRLWTAAPRRLLTQSRVAALCVSLHGTGLYRRRDLSRLEGEQAAAVRAYLAGQEELQERLGALAGVTEDERRTLARLVHAWDWLSLALCLDWAPTSFEDGPLALALAADLTLAPWPFASDAVKLVTEGRRLVAPCASEAELHAALDAAEHVELRWTLRRPVA